VRDSSGNPVPDAELKLGRGKGGSIHHSTPSSEWLFDPLTPGLYHIKVLRAGVGGRAGPDDPSRAELGEPVEVIAGETAELTVTAAARNEVITGIVRTTDGDPVADAAVWALADETYIDWGGEQVHPEVARTATDIDGRFTLDNLEPGTYSVHARSHASIEQSREGVASGGNVVIELPREASVAGRVSVRGGDPPSLFTISIKPVDARRGRSEEFLFTKGEWRIVGLAAGEVTIEVSAAEGTASTSVTIREGEQHEDVTLELAARGTLRGRVVDPETGEPVAGYYAYASSTTRGAQASALDPEGKRYTNAEGYFELQQVPSGDVSLRLWTSREASLGYRDIDVQLKVEPGKTTDAGTIEAVRRPAEPEEAK
jgi:protocatechuate 3,4-dioxygenase beta subunit